MAWTSDTHDASAGKFIDVLDNLLVAAKATWTVYDSGFATNEKVYRCYDAVADPVIDFYLHVKDNQVDYAEILMYDSWDASGHSYAVDTGCKVIWGYDAAKVPYICKKADGYYFRSADHDFVYIDKNEWEANYVGTLLPFSASWIPNVQIPIMIVSSTGYASGYNPLGDVYNHSTYCVSKAMIINCGKCAQEVHAMGYQCQELYFKTSDDKTLIRETWVHDAVTNLVLGKFNGIMVCGYRSDYDNDDYVTINGDTWRYVEGSNQQYVCFIKQNA